MVLQVCRVSFQQKSSPSVVQSAVEGKRQQFETNLLMPENERGLHFEQIRSRYVARRQSYEHGEKSSDRWTDRQTAFCLYIVERSFVLIKYTQ